MLLKEEDIVKGKPYTLKQGTGSIYDEGLNMSLGYFLAGSIITFGNVEGDYIEASIKGQDFKVTSDASFANRGSTSRQFHNEVSGLMPLSRLPSVVEPYSTADVGIHNTELEMFK